MGKQNNKPNARQGLLQAAGQIILNEGVEHLTLEAVARQAGVSKGGLLYHFPSKEALIKGLVEHLNTEFNGEIERQLQQVENPTEKGSWLRAYIRASVGMGEETIETHAALLAAIANNPQLLKPFQESFIEWQRQTEQAGVDPIIATIIRLATDGLWIAELFQLAPPTGELREQILVKLLEMSRE